MKVEFIESYIKVQTGPDAGDYIWNDNHGELVRCKDCKHYGFTGNRVTREQGWVCYLHGKELDGDDYCSYGERKEQDND